MPQRLVGLTGSLGTGKSTVAALARQWGIPVFDADQVARSLLDPGSPLLTLVISHFGAAVVTPTGSLDRLALAEIIFRDPQERQWLEAQIHPQVRQAAIAFIHEHRDPLLLLDIPLLLEAGMNDIVTEIWVVTCSPTQQWQRLQRRHPHWSDAHIHARLQHQWPLEAKVAYADRVVDNSGSLAQLQQQVRQALGLGPAPPQEGPGSPEGADQG